MTIRKLFLVCLLAMMSLVTSGCIKGVMRFNPDGSGKLEIGFNMSVQSLEEAESMSDGDSDIEIDEISDLLNSGESIIDEKTGISVTAEERLQNGSMWTYMILDVPDISLWGKLDGAMENLDISDDSDEPTNPSNLATVPVITIEGNTMRVELTIPSTADPDAEEDPFGMTAIMGAFIQLSYEIEMPGTVTDHNGQIDSLTGNPVWIIDMTSTDDLEIFVESTLD